MHSSECINNNNLDNLKLIVVDKKYKDNLLYKRINNLIGISSIYKLLNDSFISVNINVYDKKIKKDKVISSKTSYAYSLHGLNLDSVVYNKVNYFKFKKEENKELLKFSINQHGNFRLDINCSLDEYKDRNILAEKLKRKLKLMFNDLGEDDDVKIKDLNELIKIKVN